MNRARHGLARLRPSWCGRRSGTAALSALAALLVAFLVSPAASGATRSSAHYSVRADVIDRGGGRARGGPYTNDASLGDGLRSTGAGSTAERNKAGYIGQLPDAASLGITAATT